MPSVTVTIRELKNKDTGLDLSIPVYSEKSHLFGKSAECNVVAVSRLAYFKLPEHKDTDIVQFSITKQVDDFGEFRDDLAARFPGTVLPQLPKSLFSFAVGTAKQQVALLENFLQFVASTPKMATCKETLNFLGFSSVRKGLGTQSRSYRKANVLEKDVPGEDDSENLFEADADDDEDELFGFSSSKPTNQELNPATRLFEEQDYGGEVSKDDELVQVVGATDPSPSAELCHTADQEEEDLLNIEDSLPDLLTLTSKSNKKQSLPDNSQLQQDKPVKPAKPKLAPKPKGKLPPKPDAAKQKLFSETQEAGSTMETDDILRYIQSNKDRQDEDLDLFS